MSRSPQTWQRYPALASVAVLRACHSGCRMYSANGIFRSCAVVATGRRPEAVEQALGGTQDDLLVVKLDVTSPADAQAAVQAAVERFDRIDVFVNNAGNFYAGFFEEISPEDFRAQIETTLFGPMNVTRAVLPVMRVQRSGLVVVISSTAGIVGQEFCTAYAASKFGVEGWIESLTPEVASFGIRTMLVEPGFFRTELLTPESTNYAEPSIEDYAERTEQTVAVWDRCMASRAGTPPSSPRRWSGSRARTCLRCGSRPAPTRSPLSSRRPTTSWPRLTPTVTYPLHLLLRRRELRRITLPLIR